MLQLLEKRREDRVGYADLVAAELLVLGAKALNRQIPRPNPYLYRGGFAGRDNDLERVQTLLRDGGFALLGAESGGGKTRVALEIAERWRFTHHVEVAECVPLGTASGAVGSGGPLYPFGPLFLRLADGLRAGEGARLADEGAALRPFLPGEAADDEAGPAAAIRVARALSHVLGGLGKGRPTLVLVDDLQWADALTLAWLGYAIRARTPGLVVLGTYRIDEVSSGLAAVLRDADAGLHALPTLDETAVGAIVRDMLALDAPPQSFVQFLTQHAKGNPFFVGEYLQTAVAEGLLLRNEKGEWHVLSNVDEDADTGHFEQMALPSTLRDIVGRRLRGLSEPARSVAGQLAALGREAGLVLLRAAIDAPDAVLSELVARRVVEVSDGAVRFAHDKLREAAWEGISADRRAGVHRAAANALSRVASDQESVAGAIGFHRERAGEPVAARRAYLVAARAADRRHAAHDATRLYQAALDLAAPDDAEVAQACTDLARNARQIGELSVALDAAERAVGMAAALHRPDLQSEALHRRLQVQVDGGNLVEALDTARQVLATAEQSKRAPLIAQGWICLSETHRALGQFEAAYEALVSAESLESESPELRPTRIDAVARLDFVAGNLERALVHSHQAIAFARVSGSPFKLSHALNGLANVYCALDRIPEGMVAYEEALRLDIASGNRQGEAVRLANMALNEFEQGNVAQANARHIRSLKILRETGSRRYCGHALSYMAQYAAALGDRELCRARATEAAALLREVGDHSWLPMSLAELARLALEDGDPQGAMDLAREGLAGQTEASPRVDLQGLLDRALEAL